MEQEIRMSVSSFVRNGDEKAVYVQFQDGSKTAEIRTPDGKLLQNNGFAPDEIKRLQEYCEREKDTIFELARSVNPVKAFLESPIGQGTKKV